MHFELIKAHPRPCKLKFSAEFRSPHNVPNVCQYNTEIKIPNSAKHEKLFRRDNKYDYILVLNYNKKKIPFKGSAIFLHLTDNYKPTAGCIAINLKDFNILLKLINKNTKIKIN